MTRLASAVAVLLPGGGGAIECVVVGRVADAVVLRTPFGGRDARVAIGGGVRENISTTRSGSNMICDW